MSKWEMIKKAFPFVLSFCVGVGVGDRGWHLPLQESIIAGYHWVDNKVNPPPSLPVQAYRKMITIVNPND